MPEKPKINRLRIMLAEKDMSHKDFAKKMKKAPNTITSICNNEQQPSLDTLMKMAIALDVDIRELLTPTKWPLKSK